MEEASRSMSVRHVDDWNCAGGAQAREKAEAWTMGPMRGWRFRLAQVNHRILVCSGGPLFKFVLNGTGAGLMVRVKPAAQGSSG